MGVPAEEISCNICNRKIPKDAKISNGLMIQKMHLLQASIHTECTFSSLNSGDFEI